MDRCGPPRRQRGRVAQRLALAPLAVFCALALPVSAHAQTVASASWSLTPSDLGEGDRFRLLFLTSAMRDATSTDIADYDAFVHNLAASGHGDLSRYSHLFKAFGSTASVDARDHTATAGTGVPVYWLNGPRLADDYADFYDGSWDHTNPARNESGQAVAVTGARQNPFTGSNASGRKRQSGGAKYYFGTDHAAHQVGLGELAQGNPVSGNTLVPDTNRRSFYALSPVFEVARAGTPVAGSVAIHSTPARYGSYYAGDTITIGVTFDRAVTVSTVSGTPDVRLRIGANARHAAYASGSDSTELLFAYTVVGADYDADGIAIVGASLRLNGGAIGGQGADVDAVLTHDGAADRSGHRVNLSASPVAPSDLRAIGTHGAAELSWRAVDASIVRREYRRTTGTVAFPENWTAIRNSGAGESNAAGYTVSGLAAETEYRFEVRQVNGLGAGPAASASATTFGGGALTTFEARFRRIPATHDGSSEFTVIIVFNDDLPTFRHLRAGVEVVGGERVNQGRYGSGNDTWFYTVAPSGDADVAIALPAATECAVNADICSTTGNPLSSALVGTVRGPATVADDATLSALTLSGVTLVPAFDPGTETYAATVANVVASTTVTPTKAVAGAAVAYTPSSDADGHSAGHQVALDVGDTVIAARVTGANGIAMKAYTVTVSREGVPPGAPRGLAAVPGDGQVALTWAAPASAGTSAIAGYEVRYTTDTVYPDGWSPVARSARRGANDTGFTVTGLTNGTAHTFHVRAVSADGGRGAAATSAAVTPNADPRNGGANSAALQGAAQVEILSGILTVGKKQRFRWVWRAHARYRR